MRSVKLLGLALLALFALSAVASSMAAAELPEILPVPTAAKPLKFTSQTKGKPALSNTALTRKFVCEKATNKGEFTTQDHGKLTIAFTGCEETAAKAKCNTNGVAGEITLEGLIELVTLKATPLTLGLWLEPFATGGEAKKEDIKIKCGVLTITILGSLLAKVDNVTSLVKTKTALALWHQISDAQEEKTCELLKALCSTGPFELKSKFTAEGAEELAFLEAEAEITFAEEAEVHF